MFLALHTWPYVCFLTATVTLLFITTIHTIRISITAPADGDAMAIFALELIAVALHITAILGQKAKIFVCYFPPVCQMSIRKEDERYLV